MAQFKTQDGRFPAYRPFNSYESSFNCPRIWDPVHARFENCSLMFISAIPAVVASLASLFFLLRILLRGRHTPQWSRNIIIEPLNPQGESTAAQVKQLSSLCFKLLVISVLGCLISAFTIFHHHIQLRMILPTASWAFGAIFILVRRPQSTSRALLVLHISIFISQSLVFTNTVSKLRSDDIPILLGILLSFAAVVIILNMPLRNPSLPCHEISPVFKTPRTGLRSPEDNLTLWQYMTVSWMSPLIALGKTRQLHDEDVWDLAYEFQHRLLLDKFRELHGSILRRLLEANGLDLILVSIFSTIEVCANLSAPVFLQKILQTMENPQASGRAALTYAVIALAVRLIAAQASVFNLWYSRRCYERSRGELITMLYEKTLSRKVVSVSTKARANENVDAITKGDGKHVSQLTRFFERLLNPFRLCCGRSNRVKPTDEIELATMGKILNLMRFDAYEIAQRFLEASTLTAQPLGLILSVILIWRLIGWPCLIGVVAVFIAQGINAMIARVLLRWESERRIATDKKLHKISQLVESIRHLRWYGWQDIWLARIMEARQHELALRVITALWASMISFVNIFASGMFPVAAFYAYTVLAGLPLRVDIAFPALQLFGILENTLLELPNLITAFLNAKIAMGRIEEFMTEPDKLDAETSSISDALLEMKNASYAWPGASEPVLMNITLSFPLGLTVVCGEVGSGKTALLQALLGEVDLTHGEYHRSNEMVGYCAQTPWLQSMSIRENILFSTPFDEARYKQVLEACALIPDMANFKNGDLSMVGENGVGLSGGQKARLALARAVYSRSRILFLDDPLSALDHQTAETIVRRCLKGPLLEGRTTILVTHRIELCLDVAEQIVEIKNGRSRILDPVSITSDTLARVRSNDSVDALDKDDEQQLAAIPEKFMEDEHRAHGGVMASVYWEYIKASKLKWWLVLLIALIIYRLVDIGEAWFVKQWGEAYGRTVQLLTSNPFDQMPNPETNVKPWLFGFFVIATAQAVAFLIAQCIMLVIIYKAGKSLFERVMTKCTQATFRFYDVTPVGRLMNRLTSDINTVDGNISNKFQMVARYGIIWVVSIVVIASITPIFLVFALALSLAFVIIFSHFLPTSQSLRRLEMVSLSPLISNFGALADGLTTVRAFCVQFQFQERVIAVTDNFQKMDHFYWSLQAWLQYRFDVLSATSTFILTSLAIFNGISPGLTAFVLAAANRFVNATHSLCRTYGQLQMDFVSVERVVELLHIEQEPPGSVDAPAYWPALGGDIVFENVTIQYAAHLDPAISNVSLKIKGGSTTALIGRTGSGKSTLALSLLATNLPTSGRILIDNIDISTINTQALRKRVTFLAQEPVLFPGTMRANLDPIDEYSDLECSTVLSKIAQRHNWTLDTHVDTGGKNLSQGQRQLVGLARALLRRSAIVIMDEATASIDKETAMRIQEILREEMRESTVITIAHRVEAVKNADFCVELGKGRVVEVGKPGNMIRGMEGLDEG